MELPPAEVDVDAALVTSLLAEQHPDLAALEVRWFSEGWDNTLWRLGEDLAVRLPRRELAAALVEHEQRWLPEFAPRLPLRIPAPVRVGVPSQGYPWHWSVVPFLEGRPASLAPPRDPAQSAETLGAFTRALHVPAPHDAPANPYRAVPLSSRDDSVVGRISELADPAVRRRALGAWSEAIELPAPDGARTWIHGDLHPGNVLVHHGAIAGVIDFGDLCGGDPATDLAAGWLLFERADADRMFVAAGADDATAARARGWALFFAVMLATFDVDALGLRSVGEATLRRLLG